MLEGYEKLSTSQKREFSDICSKLLANTFLARDKKDNRDAYYFVVSFKDVFEEFFKILDYELILERDLGTIQLITGVNSTLLKLKKDESIVLLILRLLYHEKLRETSLNSNVVISISNIHEKYDILDIKRKLTKTDLISMLRLFRRFNLIEISGDITQSTTQLVLFPTLLVALSTQDINDVYNTISKIMNEGEAINEETH